MTIYHEKQRYQLCGIHALNNLLGKAIFTKEDFDTTAESLAPEAWFNPHCSVLGIGNYDANVVLINLQHQGYVGEFWDVRSSIDSMDLSEVVGLLCNVVSKSLFQIVLARHWFSIRKIEDTFYNVDSKLDQPLKYSSKEAMLKDLSRLAQQQDCIVIIVRADKSNT